MDTNQQLREAVESALNDRLDDRGSTVIVGDFVTIGEIMDEKGNLGLSLISDARGNTAIQMMLQTLLHMAGGDGQFPIGSNEDGIHNE